MYLRQVTHTYIIRKEDAVSMTPEYRFPLKRKRGFLHIGTSVSYLRNCGVKPSGILIRNMVVMTISVAAIASFIGAGGLGVAIYRGITIYDTAMTFSGSLLIALLAIVSDLLLGIAEKKIRKGMHLS